MISWRYIHNRSPWIWETHSWYISNGTSVEQSKYFRQRNLFPWFKYIIVIGVMFIPAFTTNAMTSDFLSSISPAYGVYNSQLVRLARYCTSVSDFNSKNLQLTSKLQTQGYRYRKLRKTFGKLFRSYSDLVSKFGEISFADRPRLRSRNRSHSTGVVYGRSSILSFNYYQMYSEVFVSSGSKIVKRLKRRRFW